MASLTNRPFERAFEMGHGEHRVSQYAAGGGLMNFTLLALVCIHGAVALKHHFVDRDAVLIRMLPRSWNL